MSQLNKELPLIDISGYLHPTCNEDKQRVIGEVRDACRDFGFFQLKGHGISVQMQKRFLNALPHFFCLPREEKVKLSFLQSPGRRGYEYSGLTMRDGDALPDSKEAFYVGHENAVVEQYGFHCPNLWPELPVEDFRNIVEEYYKATTEIGRLIWEILIQGLGHPADLVEDFSKKPVVMMKMIRYPSFSKTLAGQFGVGPHKDFGGVTVLLQEPEKEGLEVWVDDEEAWLPVPAVEDVYVINMGDMIQKWSGGAYKSAKHRVMVKGESERLSCATFWHGDLDATNPLNPNDPAKETVAMLLVKRFKNQFSAPKTFADDMLANGKTDKLASVTSIA